MQDYKDQEYSDFGEEYHENTEESTPHYFCKLTFGQFFTLMVLEIITLCFVFYLGARYGNEYLKLDVITEAKKEPVSFVSDRTTKAQDSEEAELENMARDALVGEKVDLKQKVQEILARQQGPTTPPVGEPGYNEAPPAVTPQPIEEASLAGGGQREPITLQEMQQALSKAAGEREVKTYEPTPKPAVPPTQQVVKVKSTGNARFSVQVGSYPDVKEASYRVEEWKAKGYPAYMMIANLGDKGQWYRVRIGAFADKDEAGRYLNDIKNNEGTTDAFVVQNEQ